MIHNIQCKLQKILCDIVKTVMFTHEDAYYMLILLDKPKNNGGRQVACVFLLFSLTCATMDHFDNAVKCMYKFSKTHKYKFIFLSILLQK